MASPKGSDSSVLVEQIHPWLRQLHVAYVPGPASMLAEEVAGLLMRRLEYRGHQVQGTPDAQTDVIVTTARFGEPVSWREALLVQARRRFRLHRSPAIFTVVHARPQQFADLLAHFERALAKETVDPADYALPGVGPHAWGTLAVQGQRGGPMMTVERVMQAQAFCVRLLVVVGEEAPDYAYHFDLVGAYPRSEGSPDFLYDDVILRMATAVSAGEIGGCSVEPPLLTLAEWKALPVPPAMRRASLEYGRRDFFTEMIRVTDLVQAPAIGDAIASQYSEGCFATWEPEIGALVATTTGSARPVDKSRITDDELAIISGIWPDRRGVFVRHVDGKRNDPPSSEAFEMFDMDAALPSVTLPGGVRVPVVRSKLHGHRGVAGYDARRVEYAPMGPAYFRYPVTCGTQAQAEGIRAAFARAAALQNPADARQVVFTILPGHGLFLAEKWVPGKVPFQTIWEYMDAGYLQIEPAVPQGPEVYVPEARS